MIQRMKGVKSSYELEIIRENNDKRKILMTANPIYDENGEITRTFAIIQDITNRRQTEEELKASEARYKAIFDGSTEGILIIDAETKMLKYGNPAFCKMIDYREEEISQLTVNDIHPEEALEHVMLQSETQSRGNKTTPNIQCLRKDRSKIYADVNTAKIIIDGRECIVGFYTDVTGRILTTLSMRESEEKFRAIASTANDAIIMIDNNGVVIYWNLGAKLIFGYSVRETLGKKLSDLIILEQDRKDYQQNIATLITKVSNIGERRATGRTSERYCIRKDGTVFPIEFTNSVFMISGRWHAVEIIRDISDRKRFEVQLMQAQKMESIGTLASGIAHEINTPAQFIGNNIRFLEDSFSNINGILTLIGELTNLEARDIAFDEKLIDISKAITDADVEFLVDEIPKAIEQSKQGIQNVSRIVSAMRSFAHPGTKEKNLTDIHEAIESTITISRNEWKYIADLETDFDPNLQIVPCYVAEFNQVILNLSVHMLSHRQ